jgi:hypothetical protein
VDTALPATAVLVLRRDLFAVRDMRSSSDRTGRA